MGAIFLVVSHAQRTRHLRARARSDCDCARIMLRGPTPGVALTSVNVSVPDLSAIGANLLEYLRTRAWCGLATSADAESISAEAPISSQNQLGLLHFVLDNMVEGVIVCDRNLRLVQCNRGARAMLGADLKGWHLRDAAD